MCTNVSKSHISTDFNSELFLENGVFSRVFSYNIIVTQL